MAEAAPSLKLKIEDSVKVADLAALVYPPARVIGPILRAARSMGLKEIDMGNMAATKGLGKAAGPSVLGQDGFMTGARAISATGPKGRISQALTAGMDVLDDKPLPESLRNINEQALSQPFPDPY